MVIRQGDVRDIIQGIVHEFQMHQRWTLDSPIPDEDIATLAEWVNSQPPSAGDEAESMINIFGVFDVPEVTE